MALSKSKTECSALQSEKFDLEDQLLVRDDKINELQRDLSEIINQRKKTNAQNDDIQKQIQHFQSEIVKKVKFDYLNMSGISCKLITTKWSLSLHFKLL